MEEEGIYQANRVAKDEEEGGYKANRVPRFTKMEFPTYNEKEDPTAWLQKCEDFFEEQQTPLEAWVRQATFVLQGNANSWYANLRRMKGRLNWAEFSEECKIRFGPPMSMNPLGELTHLKQTGTVEDYCSSFESLLGRSREVTPDQSIWLFCAGLKGTIRYEVKFARPTTLYYAMNLARQIELRVAEAGRFRGSGNIGNRTTPNRESGGTSKVEGRNPAWKKLTQTAMADRRAKGLCFNCDELFSVGHKCAKLFCIMLSEDGDEGPTDWSMEETPIISLNAIRGAKTDQTFQVQAQVGTGLAWVLLDSAAHTTSLLGERLNDYK